MTLAIEHRAIHSIRPAARNARLHPKRQMDELRKAIVEFGFTQPILIDEEGVIIAGHGRHQAALDLKITTVPCIVLAGLTEDRKRALALADNRIATHSTWDAEVLKVELEDLLKAETPIDFVALGFTEGEVEKICSGEVASIEYAPSFAVMIDVDSEAKQIELLERLTAEGYRCKALIA